MDVYLGVDISSVTTKFAPVHERGDLLAHEEMAAHDQGTVFRGFEVSEARYGTSSFECSACPTLCEIAQISLDSKVVARWGGHCDLWERTKRELIR